jgi:APA family basic amino acid/polyamine antiporter
MAGTAGKKPGLGVFDASLIVVGSIVGAGIFLLSGEVAREARSPAEFLAAWVLGGAVALAGALSNGELGGMFPRSGGEYVYLREAYGPVLGFLSGWTGFLVVFPGSIAALADGFGSTVAPLLGLGGWAPKVIGLMAIAALTGLNALGLSPGKWAQNVLSATKLAAFCGLLALGAVVPHALSGAPPPIAPAVPHAGASGGGVATALIPVFFAYSGWNAATYITGEMREPRRGLGKALALGTGLCAALYVAINAIYLRAMPLAELAATDQPARAAAMHLGGAGAAAVLSPLIAICVLSSMQASVLVGPRLAQAMAADGMFFAPVGRIHSTTGVPLIALLTQGFVSSVQLLFIGSFGQLVDFSTSAIVAFSTLTVAAVFVLRRRRPDAARPFRVPVYPLVPLLFVAVNIWVLWCVLASGPGALAALKGLAIVATGIPAYAAFRAWGRARPVEAEAPR